MTNISISNSEDMKPIRRSSRLSSTSKFINYKDGGGGGNYRNTPSPIPRNSSLPRTPKSNSKLLLRTVKNVKGSLDVLSDDEEPIINASYSSPRNSSVSTNYPPFFVLRNGLGSVVRYGSSSLLRNINTISSPSTKINFSLKGLLALLFSLFLCILFLFSSPRKFEALENTRHFFLGVPELCQNLLSSLSFLSPFSFSSISKNEEEYYIEHLLLQILSHPKFKSHLSDFKSHQNPIGNRSSFKNNINDSNININNNNKDDTISNAKKKEKTKEIINKESFLFLTKFFGFEHRLASLEKLLKNVTQDVKKNLAPSLETLKKEIFNLSSELNSLASEKGDFEDSILHSLQTQNENSLQKRLMESLTKFDEVKNPCPSLETLESIVQESLQKYDADKTGMFDFALETAGGSIESIRCTETYDVSEAVYSIMGFQYYWLRNTPRTLLQPTVSPGQCWAFHGSVGSVVISLSGSVLISSVSLEHIPKSLSPDGKILSAPRHFSVFSLKSTNIDENNDDESVLLGNFTYSETGASVQTFSTAQSSSPTRLVELKIHSNYGHPNYTCIYRFRVHGILSEDASESYSSS